MKTIAIIVASFCVVSAAMAQNPRPPPAAAPAAAAAPGRPARRPDGPVAPMAPRRPTGRRRRRHLPNASGRQESQGRGAHELGDQVLQGRRQSSEAEGRGRDELHQEVRFRRDQGVLQKP